MPDFPPQSLVLFQHESVQWLQRYRISCVDTHSPLQQCHPRFTSPGLPPQFWLGSVYPSCKSSFKFRRAEGMEQVWESVILLPKWWKMVGNGRCRTHSAPNSCFSHILAAFDIKTCHARLGQAVRHLRWLETQVTLICLCKWGSSGGDDLPYDLSTAAQLEIAFLLHILLQCNPKPFP